MENTSVTVGFVSPTTIQIRIELGEVVDGVQTTVFPDGIDPADANDEGFIWADDAWVGHVGGPDDIYWMPFDSYEDSPIDDLFDTSGSGPSPAAPVDDPSGWSVTVDGQEVGIVGLSRKSNILDSAETGWFEFEFSTVQNVFIELDAPLAPGQEIVIAFDDADFAPITVTYAPETTVSEAIHVNLVGFDPDDETKVAYLSSWNGFVSDPAAPNGGTGVPQSYEPGTPFHVHDAETGVIVLSGEITLGTDVGDFQNFDQNFQSTPVYEMDFSALDEEGSYYISVEDVGISQTFEVDESHWDDLFELSMSGFYHQRSGIALEAEHTDAVRPRSLHPDDGFVVYGTTVTLMDTGEGYDNSAPEAYDQFAENLTGEVLTDAWGGWHDAGDYDRRTQHMEASRKLMELYEMDPEWAAAQTLDIPEADNGIPDILDEAMWGLEVFKRMQHEDGGVPGGIETSGAASFGEGSWGETQTLYAYAPDVWSSWEYAASAAKLATLLRPYDEALADEWLASAVAAWEWAEARVPEGEDYDATLNTSRNIAALEIYRATGDEAAYAVFLETFVYGTGEPVEWFEHQYEAAYVHAAMDPALVDPALQAAGQQALQDYADFLLTEGSGSAFGYLTDPYAPYGWGNTGQQPNYSADILVRLHDLTGDPALLDAIQQDVQYTLGANPLNMVYVTGIEDVRGPEIILNADADTLGQDPPPGITLYGDYNVFDYGYDFYHDMMEDDVWPYYDQVPVSESFNGFFVYVPSTEYTVQQGISDMAYVTGYLASLDDAGGAVPDVPLRLRGTGGDDGLDGGGADDLLIAFAGNDVLRGDGGDDLIAGMAGNDTLFGGAGADVLLAGTGADVLEGGAGDDLLIGGSGADAFVFDGVFGADTVAGLALAEDVLLIDAALAGGRSAEEVVADLATVSAAGVVLDLGEAGTILLQGLTGTAGLAGAMELV